MQTTKSEQEIEEIQIDIAMPKSKNEPEVPFTRLDNQEVQATREDEQVVEKPHINSHIDFVFGDQQWQLGD